MWRERATIIGAVVLCVAMLAIGPAAAQPSPPARSDLRLELVEFGRLPDGSGVRVNEVAFAPGRDDSLFVAVQEGQIIRFDRAGNADPTPFLDLTTTAIAGDLLSQPLRYVAFHPDFVRRGAPGFGRFYTSVHMEVSGEADDDTVDVPDSPAGAIRYAWIVIEWTVTDPAGAMVVDPASAREVLRLQYAHDAGFSHGLTDLAFDPALSPGDRGYGLLYVSSGDNTNGTAGVGAPYVQRLDNLFGKILRVDPLEAGSDAYTIPASNPFVGTVGARREIFALGFRNPQQLSFENLGGVSRLVATDIGFDSTEEVNVVLAGANYGWDAIEGTGPAFATPLGPGTLRGPAVTYGHDLPSNQIDAPAVVADGPTAIAGGVVYRGTRAWSLRGQYILGDIPRGRFFHVPVVDLAEAAATDSTATVQELLVQVDGEEVLFPSLVGSTRGDVRVGRDQDGELYVSNKTDGIIRWLAQEPTPLALVPRECRDLGTLHVVMGTSGSDRLVGTAGSDLIVAGAGDDIVSGRGGRDCLVGGRGRDRLVGGRGGDVLVGGAGADLLLGGRGDDVLLGGPGADVCDGGAGRNEQRSCRHIG